MSATEKDYVYYACKNSKKSFKGHGHMVSVIEYVQKDPYRKRFIERFKSDSKFREAVGFDEEKYKSVDAFVADYKAAARAPGTKIKQKDLHDFVSSDLYKRGTYVNRSERKVRTAEGTVETFKRSELKVWDPQHDAEDVAEDATMINGFSEASLLLLMKRRLIEKFNIYTYVSDVLLCLNPYMNIPAMVNISEYPNEKHYTLGTDPHAYATAHMAYYGQFNKFAAHKNQSCIVSGESGAGKTVCCSYLMRYLAKLSTWRKMAKHEDVDEKHNVTSLITGISPFLEAFGNAKTNMNDNSSRFGKFTKIWFEDGKIIGAELEHYLLEKARLVGQGRNERNYHIFYFLLRGATKEEKKTYFDNDKTDPHDYPMLTQGWYTRDGKKDPDLEDVTLLGHGHGAEYDVAHLNNPVDEDDQDNSGVRAALRAANVSEKTQQDVWRVVAGVLRMTSITFESDSKNEEKGRVKSVDEAARIASLLSLVQDGENSFSSLLCCKIVKFDKKYIRLDRTPKQCKDNCNALAKEIYGRLFAWLINTVCNGVLMPKGSKDTFVGLLDIFGFENFVPTGGSNSIEQLCINFANEKLQFLFNKHVFDEEKEAYAADGIDASQMPQGKDNRACIDLIERKARRKGAQCGILRMLTEFSQNKTLMNKPNPNVLLVKQWHQSYGMRGAVKKAKERWRRAASELYKGNLKHDLEFHIMHYAGDIKYDATNFVQKNADKLPIQLVKVVRNSKFDFLKKLFENDDDAEKKRGSNKGRSDDLCGKYLDQLGKLATTIGKTQPHYVRCVKPNEYHFRPIDGRSAFDAYKTYRQLLYAGVMEVVKIKKMGFPFRETFDVFWKSRCVAKNYHKFLGLDPDIDSKEGTKAICEAVFEKPKTVTDKYTGEERVKYFWVTGNTKIWAKSKATEILIEWHRTQVASLVQHWWRFWGVWDAHCAFQRATLTLQSRWRQELLRRKLEKMMPDICRAQRLARAATANARLVQLRTRSDAVQTCQRFYRGIKLLRFVRRYNYVCTIQKFYRGSHILRALRVRSNAIRVQRWHRATHLLSALRNRHFVTSIQEWFRRMRWMQEWYRLNAKVRSVNAQRSLASMQRRAKIEVMRHKMNDYLSNLLRRWNAATTIQRIYRGRCARVRFDRMLELKLRADENVSIVRSEALMRMWLVRYQLDKARLRRHRAVEVIASQYTNWRTRLWWRTLRLAATCIQRHARGLLARIYAHRRRYLIVKIQASARIARWLSKYVRKHRRVVMIQSMVRMYLIRKWHRRYKNAVRVLEKFYICNRLFPRRVRQWFAEASAAAKRGDLSRLVSLVECVDEHYETRVGFVPNLVNRKESLTGRSLLHMAAESGSYECVRFLLLRNAWPDELDFSGRTPLHVSCGAGDPNRQITALLLEDWPMQGPSFYSCDPSSPTVVSQRSGGIAEWRAYARRVKERRKDISRPGDVLRLRDADGMTPIDVATNSVNESERTVVLLMRLGAEADEAVLSANKQRHAMQLRSEALSKSRLGREIMRQREIDEADPMHRLMHLMRQEISDPVASMDPFTRRTQQAKLDRAATVIQRCYRGYRVRKAVRAVIRRNASKRERERILRRERSTLDSKFATEDAKRADIESRSATDIRGRPEQRRERRSRSPTSKEFISERMASSAEDARLMELLEMSKCAKYLQALEAIGLKEYDDLVALSPEDFDAVCTSAKFLLMDKLRLRRTILATRGRAAIKGEYFDAAQRVETVTSERTNDASVGERTREELRELKTPGDRRDDEQMDAMERMRRRVEEATRGLEILSDVESESRRSDSNTKEPAPSSPPGMSIDHSSGALARSSATVNPDVLENGHRALAQMYDILTVLSTPSDERGWSYVDTRDNVRGPFTRETMRTWFEAGHLPPTLCTRFGTRSSTPFQMIRDRFFPSMSAFVDRGDLRKAIQELSIELRNAMYGR